MKLTNDNIKLNFYYQTNEKVVLVRKHGLKQKTKKKKKKLKKKKRKKKKKEKKKTTK